MEYNINGIVWYGSKDNHDDDYCGKGCYWRIEDGTLIISGNGDLEWARKADSFPEGTFKAPSDCRSLRYSRVIVEKGIKSLGRFAFAGQYIDSIELPDGLLEIGSEAFLSCDDLSNVTIPESVVRVDGCAFSGCKSFTHIVIPKNVAVIDSSAFVQCGVGNDLIITVDEGNQYYTDINGVLFSKDRSKLIAFRRNSNTYVIPDSVTEICDYAFYRCEMLESVVIPDSVTRIGTSAFSICSHLEDVVIPNSVTEIDEGAFSNCDSLKNINIPDSVEKISKEAFLSTSVENISLPGGLTKIEESTFLACNSLTSITIPDSMTEIKEFAFHGCKSLHSVTFKGTDEQWVNIKVGAYNNLLLSANIQFEAS